MDIRLNKAIAHMGICSRRKADELIAAGKVKVNGKLVTEMATKVNPDTAVIFVDGMRAEQQNIPTKKQQISPKYIVLNKPVDYICSTTNEQGPSVLDLITAENYYKTTTDDIKQQINSVRLYPVGRLDKDSEGLVLLTNDGELTNRLTHPRFKHAKEYEVTLPKPLDKKSIAVLEKGMDIGEGEFVRGIEIKKTFNKGRQTIVTIVLREGKNRQIRKMFGILGYHVQTLRRTRLGKIRLTTLPVGHWKFVGKSDII
ncbi:rRNA pseudouridine synthase [Patescibacteria group bacterium]|nr:rRNA pseudouridine synthase [Patescibacteria group bacterium]MBU1721332.1 rRNA pseudouridine synthase [Patescibacteria group bacterium]MBU1901617.1 rRNA pseudouridine synthase [Patescibacteria group bacterium]